MYPYAYPGMPGAPPPAPAPPPPPPGPPPAPVIAGDKALRSVAFRKEREATWRELETLIAQVQNKRITALSAEQLARLPHLYRATLSSLSVARSISLDRALTEYLETLCGRAYFCVYGTRDPARSRVLEFLTWRWPEAVRRCKWQLAFAALFMLLGVLTAFFMVQGDPENYYTFVPDAYAQGRDPSASTNELRGVLYDETDFGGALTHFAASLFSHNAGIGIVAFALGFTIVITMLLMFMNGLILGAFAALYDSRGLSIDLWGWLLPHGVTELLAVMLCGAAGLAIGQAWVFPGEKLRMDNLRERGRDAGLVVLGAVIMLFIAGLIEGIFRQTVTSLEVRWIVASATAAFWLWYFALCGRGRARDAHADAEAAR
jgi:uncharacterized membrane protein SpoIIM required for sporulation